MWQSGKDVLTVTGLSKSFDSQTLFTDVNFEIQAQGNGWPSSATTAPARPLSLKSSTSCCPPDAGEIRLGSKVHIGYYDQEHQVLHMDKTLFDEIQDTYPSMNNTQIRNTLASFLFTGDDVFKLIRDLSGGERGRVSLAKLMLSDANFCSLSPPTIWTSPPRKSWKAPCAVTPEPYSMYPTTGISSTAQPPEFWT